MQKFLTYATQNYSNIALQKEDFVHVVKNININKSL